MTTKDVVQLYFRKVKDKSGWQDFIADDMRFESPSPAMEGREAYIAAATRFFSMAESLEIKGLITEDETACACVDYALVKNGRRFNCMVYEWLEVRNDRIISSVILFDTLALKEFTSQG